MSLGESLLLVRHSPCSLPCPGWWPSGRRSGIRWLIIYTLLVMIAFYLRVLLAEEPWARRRFGAEWEAYRHGCRGGSCD